PARRSTRRASAMPHEAGAGGRRCGTIDPRVLATRRRIVRAHNLERAAGGSLEGVPTSMTLGLAIASGVLYGLAFAPWRLWPLAWIALVPLLLATREGSWRRAALYGWVWTMALSLTVIPWFGAGAAAYFGQAPLVGIALFLVVPTVTGALEYASFAVVHRSL